MAIERRFPLPRCYRCGNSEISGICHECRRPVCQQHSYTVPRLLGRWLFHRFAGLNLEKTVCGSDPLVCSACRRTLWTPGAWLILTGSVVFPLTLGSLGLGYVLMRLNMTDTIFVTQQLWLLVTLVIGLMLLVFGLLYRGRRPFLPVLWRPMPGKIVETLTGSIVFKTNTHLQTEVDACKGQMALPGILIGEERQRVTAYCLRFRLPVPPTGTAIAWPSDLIFHAGFALLKGRFSGAFDVPLSTAQRHEHLLYLEGKVWKQPFFSGRDTRDAMRWDVNAAYTIPPPAKLPVRLFPLLVETRNERTLELELQWDDVDGLRDVQVKELSVEIPIALGAIVHASDEPLTDVTINPDTGIHTLKWHAPPLDELQRKARRRVFEIQFECNLDPSVTFHGQVIMNWTGTFSRLDGMDIFFPLGRLNQRAGAILQSSVVAKFDLSLAGLRYQKVRIVPRQDDRNHIRLSWSRMMEPDHSLVAALTSALLNAGYEVLRVVEAAPQADSRSGALTLLWDIKGRAYHGVCAIDFHLVVGGEAKTSKVKTEFWLQVQGLYGNAAGERLIKRTWNRLFSLITHTLNTYGAITWPPSPSVPLPLTSPTTLISALDPAMNMLVAALVDRLDENNPWVGISDDQQRLLDAPDTASNEQSAE